MKILLLNYEYPPLGGGAGLISQYIAEGLAGRGHQTVVITTWFPGQEEDSTSGDGTLRIIRLHSLRKHTYKSNVFEMRSWIRHAKAYLNDHLKNQGFDLIFANFALPGGEVARVFHRKYKIPYVILSHGHDIPWFYPRQMWFYHLLTWGWIRLICRNASCLFVQSEDMLNNARRFLGRSGYGKIRLIHNGADFTRFFPEGGLRSERFRILFAGRLVKQKGPLMFLHAIKKLAARNIPFEVLVIGDGPMRRPMMDQVKKEHLQHYVRFIGWLDKQEMPDAYRTAHCMVAPSRNEGMSMALIEALASGLYVFTTAVSCNDTLINPGINGEIIPMHDTGYLADRLMAFYQEKFLNDFRVPVGEVKNFHQGYDWEHIISRYEEALLLTTGRGGSTNL